MITRDGGMKVEIEAKLLEIGDDEGEPCAIFQRVVDPETGLRQDNTGPMFRIPMAKEDLREMGPLLYQELTFTVNVVPKRK